MDRKHFIKIGISAEGKQWFAYSTDGLKWCEPYVFQRETNEHIFRIETTTVTVEGTLASA